ncbi:MAG: hypothetical protein JXE06_04875 [Coriobacteriia bacterium]|nr:hypothetical protein [Coriobacteriia bacterium]MBN2822112.1 hypothetical protein [Coriobacteriia bacterium]
MDEQTQTEATEQSTQTDDPTPPQESAPVDEAVPETGRVVADGSVEALAVEEAVGISWTPFMAYLALWVVLCVAAVVLLRPAALDGGARWVPEYLYAVYAGLGMTALGPVLALVVWLVVRARREEDGRRGLFVSALVKGAVVTFTGVLLWIVALYILDALAMGALV